MPLIKSSPSVLLTEDNDDDALLMLRAFQKANPTARIYRAQSGKEAMDYLSGVNPYSDRESFPIPGIILLDLKMPEINGFDIIRWVRSHKTFQGLVIVVLSSSNRKDEIRLAYHLGANSYFVKPSSFTDLLELSSLLHSYWLERATLSAHDDN